ncbi:transcription elongation factor, GreA/GreB [Pseudoalteromonas luteoviolacea]|uniref:Transcription elongation factor, GreA/GreB n=1 Tax=Pseudoalteromonas luteoviolacea (strain 2ta16) TaxID=1353533 RepID=V4J6R5_PSEL2|nr:transcription elongation factor, GreA/GreB [Pseudoalteromonas luteoviolacea]ESP91002.1 transcription elongation factor, GreA/GreB [Pseudoalteromonas luteoviolacea 2ta16]MBQ4836729.1 transcription elongation factor GreAB [Pseudoalteromonas luteoviolacea]
MKKVVVVETLRLALEKKLYEAQAAADSARMDAIHEQSAAETQYDSLSIESGYLAEGQSERVEQAHFAINAFESVFKTDKISSVVEGALVKLSDEEGDLYWYFIGPTEGGLKVTISNTQILVLTLQSPLGQVLKGKQLDDEVEFDFNGSKQFFYIDEII